MTEWARRLRTARLPPLSDAPPGRDRRLFPAAAWLAGGAAAVLAAKVFLPQGLPNGIVLLGAIIGGINALPAMGIVLVWRANRVVNFAQGELGAFAASLAFLLIMTLHWPWIAAILTSLLAATLVGALVEFGIVRRFFTAPRLLLTVAVIGLAQLLTALRYGLPAAFPDVPPFAGSFPSPLHRPAFRLAPALYSWDDVLILVVVPVVMVAIALFLRGTWIGLGTRAAAENADRSRLFGIRVRRLSTIVWAIAGLLSGLTAILKAPVEGFSLFSGSGSALFVRALAPAAVAGFESLPVTVFVAIVLGIAEQAFLWNFARGGPIETLLLGIVLVALLVRSLRMQSFAGAESSSWTSIREARRVPRRVLALPEVRAARVALGLVAAVLVVAAPRILDTRQTALAGLVGVHILVGLSMIVLTGWSGQVSLGQWALVGVGAFVAGNVWTRWHIDFFAILALGTLAGALVSLVLGIPAQRMPGVLFGATTLAFALASQSWLFQLPSVRVESQFDRPQLFGTIGLASTQAYYYVILAALVVGLAATRNIKRFRIADQLVASRDNPRAAEAFGTSVTHARRTAFLLSGALAGFAGVLYAFHQQVVDANRFAPEIGISVLSMVVIGGLGSISGVVLGATLVRVSQYLLPGWVYFFTTGIGLLFVLLVFPGGIGEVIFRVRYRLLVRVARRRGLMLPPPVREPEPAEPLLEESPA